MSDASSSFSNEGLAAKLKEVLSQPSGIPESRWSYHQAAAVLSSFEMDHIIPFPGSEPNQQAALDSLASDSWLVPDPNRKLRWTLRTELRKDALKRLGTEENIKAALESNPKRAQDPLQRAFEDYLFHRAEPVEKQTVQQLLNTLQVAEWLNGLVADVPDPELVRSRLETESLLAPFRYLVGNSFRGRQVELKRLSDYVGVIETGGFISRHLDYLFSSRDKLLIINGPGGIGKSTLLGKFILDHVEFIRRTSPDLSAGESADNEDRRFPFVYFDFDRASLAAEEPITLLIEATRQLEVQFPESRVSLSAVRESWLRRISSRSQRKRSESGVSEIARIDKRELFLDEFSDEIKLLRLGEKPFLLILDTFEEVQYRSRAFVDEVFSFLRELKARIPTLRAVISGRAQVESSNLIETENLSLSKFDTDIAQAFLMSHGIEDSELARQVAEQVGGSPLTLKLAVELLHREAAGSGGIKDLKIRDSFLRRLEDQAIQAQLFTRILGHIHDPEIVKLAHPGLVLRRVTPELIFKVLAAPCGVKVGNLEEAKQLFDRLAKEISLVTQVSADVIVHRPDLRSVMLEPLKKNKPDAVKAIHEGAIGYYKQFDDDISRAEEIYHRLSLELDRKVLDERWRDGVRQYLGSAIEELPVKAKAFLAARMGLELDESIWKDAELEDWEIHAERRARDLLELKQPIQAVADLRQRVDRTANSPLLLLERDILIAALNQMLDFFSVYKTVHIERHTMSMLHTALLRCLKLLDLPAETFIAVRRTLNLDRPGDTTQ
jgi:hypothetical protein